VGRSRLLVRQGPNVGQSRLIPEAKEETPLRLAVEAMGTRFELVLANPSAKGIGEMAIERIVEEDARLSAFRRDSLVSLINRQSWKNPVTVDGEFMDLLLLCEKINKDSNGAFDPTIGHQMAALGFRGKKARQKAVNYREGIEKKDTAVNGFPLLHLNPKEGTVYSESSDLKLDLGAVGKGWALDMAAEILKAEGVETALLHGGTSTVVALGHPPNNPSGWKIKTRKLHSGSNGVVNLRDAALSVSACDGRTTKYGDKEIGHVLDPRSGKPVPEPRAAIAIANSAAVADAWSTALLVLGEPPPDMPLHMAQVSSQFRTMHKP